MTARLQVIISDNLDHHEKGIHTDASRKHVISLDGEVRELDLTEEHSGELVALMRRYLDAGDLPGTRPDPPDQPAPVLAARPDPAVSGWEVARAMREWADRNMPGSYSRRGGGRTGYAYDPALRRAYWGTLRDLGSSWQYHRMFSDLNEEGPRS